jgi:hypothetical protein
VSTTTQTKSKPVIGHTLKVLDARDWPVPEDIISPWLKQGESCMIWAGTGVGKTMLSLTLALLVAGGGTMAGWSNNRPRKVLYIDGEMRTADMVERLRLLAGTLEGISRLAAWSNLEIRSRQDQKPDVEFYDICDTETQDQLCAYLRKQGFEMLILDNLTTLSSVKDENDAAAMRPLLGFMHKLKRDGIATILVHHSNKSGNGYRGSTAIATTFEAIIGLKRPETAASDETKFSVEFDKFRCRRSEAVKPKVFSLEPQGWVSEDNDSDDIGRLLKAIETCTYTTQGAAGTALGFDKTKTSRLLGKAKADGRTDAVKLAAYFEAALDIDINSPGFSL